MPEDKVMKLFKQGQKEYEKGNFDKAKQHFLDAADIAVDLSKSELDEKDRYTKIARDLIDLAKKSNEKSKEDDDKKDEKARAAELKRTSELLKPKTKPSSSSRRVSKSRQSDKFKDKIPSEIQNYELPEKEEIDMVLGTHFDTEYRWRPGDLMNGIMMVTGGSGSGKTEWLKSAATELIPRGYPVLIIDLHGDIDVEIPSFSMDYQGEFGINPMALVSIDPRDGGPIPQIELLLNMFEDAVKDKFSATQVALLRHILQLSYDYMGVKSTDPKTWKEPPPSFETLKKILYNPRIAQSANPQVYTEISNFTTPTFTAVKNRLNSILSHPAFQSKYMLPLEKMLEVPIRVILKDLPTVETQFVFADTLLRQLFDKVQSMGHIESDDVRDKFRLFIVIDETKILSGNRGQVEAAYNILNRLATEARKYGIGLFMASQLSRHFGRDIKANASTKLMLRPMDIEEAKAGSKELEVPYEELFDLDKPGKGYLRATNLKDAILIQLYPVDNRPLLD